MPGHVDKYGVHRLLKNDKQPLSRKLERDYANSVDILENEISICTGESYDEMFIVLQTMKSLYRKCKTALLRESAGKTEEPK